MKSLCNPWAVFVTVALASSPALALDGYRSRKGGLYGGGFGAAAGKTDVEGAERRLGYTLRARAGGGITEKLTLDAELGVYGASYTQSGLDISNRLLTMGLGVNFFAVGDLYVRGTMGMGQFSVDVAGDEDSETQLYYGGGLGYEFFANADLAAGIGADVLLSRFNEQDYTLINIGVTLIHY